MIHYHGFPVNPGEALIEMARGGHALFTWQAVPHTQIDDALQVCQSFMLDNGAYSAWKAGQPIVDWSGYYEWVYRMARLPSFDFAVIPDVIDGNESANDALLEDWPHSDSMPPARMVPVQDLQRGQ